MSLLWERIKPFVIVIGFIIVVVGLAVLIWFLFFAPLFTPSGNVNGNVNGGGTLPLANGNANIPVTNGGTNLPNVNGIVVNGNENANVAPANANVGVVPIVPLPISSTPTLGGGLSSDGSGFVYYNKNDGKFYKTDASGFRQAISDQVFPDASNVIVSPDSSKAIVQFPDGSNISYDFSKQQQYTLPKEGKDFSFTADGSQVAYKFMAPDPENRYIVMSNADGSGFRLISPIGTEDSNVQVNVSPTGQVAALFRKGIDADRQEVFFIGQQGENFKSMFVSGRDFTAEWSPQGDRMLFSVYTPDADYKPTLWIVEAQGDRIGLNRTDLKINTWADKCTFDSGGTTAYCAVPNELPTGAGLVRELADKIPDTLYKIDLRTGTQSPVSGIQGLFTADQLILSKDGKTLFYHDKNNGFMYQVGL